MDWDLAIRRHRGALWRLLGMLVAMLGPAADGRASRGAYLGLLRVLRPAESAVRRLVVMAARGMSAPRLVPRAGAMPDFLALRQKPTAPRARFALIDPRKRFAELTATRSPCRAPRLSMPGIDDPVFAATAEEKVDTARVRARLSSLRDVLSDVPKTAWRLVRMQARAALRKRWILSPLRPGWPPGHRAAGTHPVDGVLADCHALAFHALHGPPDTS